jgi:transposase-like protein
MPSKERDLLMCPDCEDGEGVLRHYPEDNNTFESYRCSTCSGEFFPDELKRISYKTIKFVNDDGIDIYIPMTPDRIARLKKAGVYKQSAKTRKSNNQKTLNRRDKGLLRRLRK